MIEYLLNMTILVLIFVILAMSLDLVIGHTGILSLAHASFFAIGAYTMALGSTLAEWSFLSGLAAGAIASSCIAVLFFFPAIRLKGDMLVISTFCFQVIVYSLLLNWTDLTGGPMGIPNLPRPEIFGLRFVTSGQFLLLVTIFFILTFFVTYRLTTGAYGRTLHAIRESADLAAALGKNVSVIRAQIFAISGALAAMSGGLYAAYVSFVDPSSFTIMQSILIVAMVILGGPGTLCGPLIGAILLVTLPEILRFAGIPASTAGHIQEITYGLALVFLMIFRPRGLLRGVEIGRS